MDKEINNAYLRAQDALALLKSAIHSLLLSYHPDGLKNVEIGKTLGIYQGHIGHEGHISRTILSLMENEGTINQNRTTKKWHLCDFRPDP